jgi:hypothetical protein
MKSFFKAAVPALFISSAMAQDFVATEAPEQEITAEAPDLRPTIDGIVAQIFSSKPWQAVNPVAPAEYGTGEKNVTKDIAGGTPYQASTLTVVGVEW